LREGVVMGQRKRHQRLMKLHEDAGLNVRLFSGGYVAMVDDYVVGMSMQKFEKMMVE
jgi:hypothetical protein